MTDPFVIVRGSDGGLLPAADCVPGAENAPFLAFLTKEDAVLGMMAQEENHDLDGLKVCRLSEVKNLVTCQD